ncbi:MAG TPA: DUF1801 domain-containing protein [Candidatus Polarisedimenticolaceae bacterium]|nr:DUF1801 domain-containing protein [Candidatus Polarisedimenticolaceae bacterium]
MSAKPIDAYLAKTPQPQRKTLSALRGTLRRLLPRAEEALSYGMPCFKVDGKGVAGFAAFKAHCTYFPMSGSVVGLLERDLARYKVSKGGVQFAADKPLPPALLKKLVKARLEELSTRPGSGSGPALSYYDNGVIASRGRLEGGRMHGKWEFFRRDGSVMRTGEFKDGEQSGVWVTWDKHGRKVKESRF